VVSQVEYSVSYTLGGKDKDKDKAKAVDGSYAISGRIGSLSQLNVVVGLSFFTRKINNVA
jgi:hypothetical protein